MAEEILVNTDEKHHARMKAESAYAHRSEDIIEQLQEHMMYRAHLLRVVDMLRPALECQLVNDQERNADHDSI